MKKLFVCLVREKLENAYLSLGVFKLLVIKYTTKPEVSDGSKLSTCLSPCDHVHLSSPDLFHDTPDPASFDLSPDLLVDLSSPGPLVFSPLSYHVLTDVSLNRPIVPPSFSPYFAPQSVAFCVPPANLDQTLLQRHGFSQFLKHFVKFHFSSAVLQRFGASPLFPLS